MNRSTTENIIEDIRARCDIVDLINSFVPLEKAGKTRWKACCPFHKEKTPSFIIDNQRQRYRCFGCGKGGDIFSFMMEYEGIDFSNAVHLLAAKCGVIIPEKLFVIPTTSSHSPTQQDLYDIDHSDLNLKL
jgi:DNA primase